MGYSVPGVISAVAFGRTFDMLGYFLACGLSQEESEREALTQISGDSQHGRLVGAHAFVHPLRPVFQALKELTQGVEDGKVSALLI